MKEDIIVFKIGLFVQSCIFFLGWNICIEVTLGREKKLIREWLLINPATFEGKVSTAFELRFVHVFKLWGVLIFCSSDHRD